MFIIKWIINYRNKLRILRSKKKNNQFKFENIINETYSTTIIGMLNYNIIERYNID